MVKHKEEKVMKEDKTKSYSMEDIEFEEMDIQGPYGDEDFEHLDEEDGGSLEDLPDLEEEDIEDLEELTEEDMKLPMYDSEGKIIEGGNDLEVEDEDEEDDVYEGKVEGKVYLTDEEYKEHLEEQDKK